MSYKDRARSYVERNARRYSYFMPSGFSLRSVLASIDNASDSEAEGIANGFYSFLESLGEAPKRNNSHPHVSMETIVYKDRTAAVFNPYTGEVFAYYGGGKGMSPFYSGQLNESVNGRGGIISPSGILSEAVKDGIPLNYEADDKRLNKRAA